MAQTQQKQVTIFEQAKQAIRVLDEVSAKAAVPRMEHAASQAAIEFLQQFVDAVERDSTPPSVQENGNGQQPEQIAPPVQ